MPPFKIKISTPYIVWTFWCSFLFVFLFANTPSSTGLEFIYKKNLTHLMPQGWGFFTRNPREQIIDAYAVEKNGLKLLTINNTSPDNLFGLSRESRMVGFEVSKILPKIDKEYWVRGVGSLNLDSIGRSVSINLEDDMKYFLPGEYVLHQYKVVPFAWANKNQEKFQPYLAVRINIKKTR